MRRLVCCAVLAACAIPASAKAGSDLAAKLDALAKQVSSQARQLETQAGQLEEARRLNGLLEERIRRLEQRPTAAAPIANAQPSKDTQRRLDTIEGQAIVTRARQQAVLERLARSTVVSGYAAVAVAGFDDETTDLELATMELLVDANPAPRLQFRGEFEFEAGSPGDEQPGHAALEIEEAWVQYAITPWLRPRAGVVLVPFGTHSTRHFDTVRDLTSEPLVARQVVPATWSETGIGLTGALGLPEWGGQRKRDLGLDYELYAINGLTDRLSDTSPRAARGAQRGDNNDDKAVVGRLALTATTLFELGVSGYYGAYDPRGDKAIAALGLDWDLHSGPFRLLGEYSLFDVERGLSDAGIATPGSLEGFYLEPSYTFWPSVLEPIGRKYMDRPTFTAVARWGFAEIGDDGDTGTGNNREERLTLGVNLRPVDSLVLKLEWQHNTTAREALEHGDNDGLLGSVAASF